MTLAGRVVLVRFVLTAIPVYLLVAIQVPKWFIRAIDKIMMSFLWKGMKEINGGSCLVAWEKVMRPIDLGWLGIHNLVTIGWGLQICWLWIEKIKPDRPWADLEVPVHPNTVFTVSVIWQWTEYLILD